MMTTLDHPLVQDYLRRLREESQRLPVDEAHDLETQIREHLTAALGEDPTEGEVREVLHRLGQPAMLVAEAGGATVPPADGPTQTPGSGQPQGPGSGQPQGPGSGQPQGPGPGQAHDHDHSRGRQGDQDHHGRQDDHDGRARQDNPWREIGALVGLVGATLLFWFPVVNVVLWLGGLVLLVIAQRWSVADKLWGALVLGLAPWLSIAAGAMAYMTTGEVCETDSSGVVTCTGGGDGGLTALNIVAITVTIAFAVLYLWTLVRLARRAARPA